MTGALHVDWQAAGIGAAFLSFLALGLYIGYGWGRYDEWKRSRRIPRIRDYGEQ